MNKKSLVAKASIVLSVAMVSTILMVYGTGVGGAVANGASKPASEQTQADSGSSSAAPTPQHTTKDVNRLQCSPGTKPPRSSETAPSGAAGRASDNTSETTVGEYTVKITGGYDTNPVDHGRPVNLIASALGVKEEVFREAFSGVTPAGSDRGPSHEEAEQNKKALLEVLAPYGITNDQLDEVSNYYRYNQSRGQLWQHVVATAKPVVTDGKVTGFAITNAGAGYSSAPTVTVTGPSGTVTATAKIQFTGEFATNGSIVSLTLSESK